MLALVWLRISRAPGWESMRHFAAVALTASMYCLGDLAQVIGVPDEVLALGLQLALASGSLHALAWVVWLAASQHRELTRSERYVIYAGIALSVLALWPRAVVSGTINTFSVDRLGIVYRIAVPAMPGLAIYGYLILVVAMVGWSCWRRQRERYGRSVATIAAMLIVAGIHDILVSAKYFRSPLLTDTCVFLTIVGFGLHELQRFIGDAHRLVALSNELEQQVVDRTAQLTYAQSALARAEKLTAISQLAAGVAHEVNNPAAIVKSNLEFAFTALQGKEQLSEEVRTSLTDSMVATRRIARVVRQLLDAGRTAGEDSVTLLPCDPGLAIGRAVARLRQSFGKTFSIDTSIGCDTRVCADISILEQVLYNLLQNAAHAVMPRGNGGRIGISTQRRESLVMIEVSDNGDGIPSEFQGRLFEPFFTTREFGHGTGLGLAVSLGLTRAQQGDLQLLRSSPEGSVFGLSLMASLEDKSSMPVPVMPSRHAGLHLLIIDDERQVRDGLRRTLGRSFFVDVAAGVDEALELIRTSQGTIDAVLCDVLMPAGGGSRFYDELCRSAPELAKRTLFMTGGATSAEAKQFLARYADRIMLKPLDHEKLREAILAMTRVPMARA